MEQKKEDKYTMLLVTCFLIPIIGFISGAMHIDTNNKLAKQCMTFAWAGIIIVVALVLLVILINS